MMKSEFIGTCVYMPVRQIEEFDDSARAITYRTFVKNVGAEALAPWNSGTPKLKNDWHVQYEVGRIDGVRVYCMHHSAIHHIFRPLR